MTRSTVDRAQRAREVSPDLAGYLSNRHVTMTRGAVAVGSSPARVNRGPRRQACYTDGMTATPATVDRAQHAREVSAVVMTATRATPRTARQGLVCYTSPVTATVTATVDRAQRAREVSIGRDTRTAPATPARQSMVGWSRTARPTATVDCAQRAHEVTGKARTARLDTRPPAW